MTFSVRRAGPGDLARLVEMRMAFVVELTEYEDTPERRAATEPYLERAIADGSFICWVAEAHGDVVGTGGMVCYERLMSREGSGWEGYVLNVYTEPEWRGRGVASAIMRAIVEHARENGLKLGLLATPGGKRVYERLDFTTDDRYMRWSS